MNPPAGDLRPERLREALDAIGAQRGIYAAFGLQLEAQEASLGASNLDRLEELAVQNDLLLAETAGHAALVEAIVAEVDSGRLEGPNAVALHEARDLLAREIGEADTALGRLVAGVQDAQEKVVGSLREISGGGRRRGTLAVYEGDAQLEGLLLDRSG